uniref:SHR-BD domain-containing protein n=1 Tax=Macrostomum lignano TaxID=282301 RepID=A0A1I8FD96_9PLAT
REGAAGFQAPRSELRQAALVVARDKISLALLVECNAEFISQTLIRHFCPQKAPACYGYRVVMEIRDADLHAFDDNCERQWNARGSLAGIVSDELVTPGGSVFSSFAQRLSGQVHHFIHVLPASHVVWRARPPVRLTLLANSAIRRGASPSSSAASSSGSGAGSLIRDEFNLHKLLVVATRTANWLPWILPRGRSVWRLMIPMPAAAAVAEGTAADSARTANYGAFPAGTDGHCTVQRLQHRPARAVLIQPITGIGIGLAQRLQSRLLQALLVPQPSHDNGQYIRPLMLLSDTLQVTLYPAKTALPHGFKSLNLYTIDRITGCCRL